MPANTTSPNSVNQPANTQTSSQPISTIKPIPTNNPAPEKTPSVVKLSMISMEFATGASIPVKYTCNGLDINPELQMVGAPANTKSMVLIMDDPDAPSGDWTHWLVFNISPATTKISQNSVPTGAVQGRNSWGKSAYGGPCPPSGTHRYFFKLYALDTILNLTSTANKATLLSAMQGHILEQTELMGKYSQ